MTSAKDGMSLRVVAPELIFWAITFKLSSVNVEKISHVPRALMDPVLEFIGAHGHHEGAQRTLPRGISSIQKATTEPFLI